MHILPFDTLERNLIALGPIMFLMIAGAYSLIVMPSVDCRIMVWSWVGEYCCFVTFAYELVGSVRFAVLGFVRRHGGMHTRSHTTRTHCARIFKWVRIAVLGSPTQFTVVYLTLLTL